MYILDKDLNDATTPDAGWRQYETYLHDNADRLPASALAFATAPWHYNPRDPRCPHDAWVERLVFEEQSSGERHEIRKLQITAVLLGAYHDGQIEIRYEGVTRACIDTRNQTHGDWLRDEIRLSETGAVVHEVELQHAHWLIECQDIAYRWQPFDTP
jgi:hypothetical protein